MWSTRRMTDPAPQSQQQQEMLDIAMRLQDEAPTDLQDANVAVAQIPPDATGQERADAIRAYSEALNEWTKANCD